MTKARIIERPVTVYDDPGDGVSGCQVPIGTEVELGPVKTVSGVQWVAVSLPDGKAGYMPGSAKVFATKCATLLQDEVAVRVAPSSDSGVVSQYRKGAQFDLIDQVSGDGETWVKIRDSGGNEGFIDGKTRIRTGDGGADSVPSQKETARKNMAVGAGLCALGLLITLVTYSSAQESGGTYFVAYGPVLYGGWKFLKGLGQYIGSE